MPVQCRHGVKTKISRTAFSQPCHCCTALGFISFERLEIRTSLAATLCRRENTEVGPARLPQGNNASRACPTCAGQITQIGQTRLVSVIALRKSGKPDLCRSLHCASRVNPTCAVDRQQTITAPSRELYRRAGKSVCGECYPSLPRGEELLKAPRFTLLQQAGCPAFARHIGQPAIFPIPLFPLSAHHGRRSPPPERGRTARTSAFTRVFDALWPGGGHWRAWPARTRLCCC